MATTGSTIVDLGVDSNTDLQKRARLKMIMIDDERKEVNVRYSEETLSPTGVVVNSDENFYKISGDRFKEWDNTVGIQIRPSIENKIKQIYNIS